LYNARKKIKDHLSNSVKLVAKFTMLSIGCAKKKQCALFHS